MPRTTRWFLKSALGYLVASLLLGVVMAAPRGAAVEVPAPVYVHLFVVGWVSQTIFGVAFWMFPRLSSEAPRGSERLAIVTYVTLNAGLIARAVAETVIAHGSGGIWPEVLIVSGALQWIAALAFAINTWPRIKER